MLGKWPWFERRFSFDFPVEKYCDILERLRGTPARIEELTRNMAADILTRRQGETWSIQENIGHLADLEPLWMGRIDDVLARADVMREADLTNAGTFAAEHNARAMGEVTSAFRELRGQLVQQLESLSISEAGLASNHPRLGIQMRIVDLCMFVADHDDYHLARIAELNRILER